MAGTSSTTTDNADEESPEFPANAVYRQPADELGPRAQRTIARIVEATREVFLTHGYAGTTIDEIARAADVSRASFYTYFPSKREVLLAVGARSVMDTKAVLRRLPEEGSTLAGLRDWVREYFQLLDGHGAFAFAWTQAAHEDEAIRTAGMKGHMALSREFGEMLAASAGKERTDTVELGIAMFSLLERSWSYAHLYSADYDRDALEEAATLCLWGAARQVPGKRKPA
ncbi:MAG: TetR/AcrR family transcriptional regulator [Actinomycetota bacterium]|nr:TetR/AcrR family transcriptional regulator [Actinomycetota bacterium]